MNNIHMIMMRSILFLMTAVLLYSCTGKTGKTSASCDTATAYAAKKYAPDSMALPNPACIQCMPSAYRYGNEWTNFAPGTFAKKTYVYNAAHQRAAVIDSLPFYTPLNILAEYDNFFLVCTPKAQSGYVKKTDLYLHSLFWGLKSCTYLFGINKYGTNDNSNCNTSSLKVIKLNADQTIADTYTDSIMGKNYEVKLIYHSALKNADAVFYLNYDCYSEIGISNDHFIVDNGKKLSQLLLTGSSGDGGNSDATTVYLPVRVSNGTKVVLAKNGVLSVDATTARIETLPYPANCGIPLNELIVIQSQMKEMLWDDKKGRPKLNKDGTMAENITHVRTTYYRWDGDRLLQR